MICRPYVLAWALNDQPYLLFEEHQAGPIIERGALGSVVLLSSDCCHPSTRRHLRKHLDLTKGLVCAAWRVSIMPLNRVPRGHC